MFAPFQSSCCSHSKNKSGAVMVHHSHRLFSFPDLLLTLLFSQEPAPSIKSLLVRVSLLSCLRCIKFSLLKPFTSFSYSPPPPVPSYFALSIMALLFSYFTLLVGVQSKGDKSVTFAPTFCFTGGNFSPHCVTCFFWSLCFFCACHRRHRARPWN